MKKSITLAALFLFAAQLVSAAEPSHPKEYSSLGWRGAQKIKVSLEVMDGTNLASAHTVTFDESGSYPIDIRSGYEIPYIAKRAEYPSKEVVSWANAFNGVSLEVKAAITADRKIEVDLRGEKFDVKTILRYGGNKVHGPQTQIAAIHERLILEDDQKIMIAFGPNSALKVHVKRIAEDDDNE